jgi:putative transposase
MDWLTWVNEPQTQTELEAVRQAVSKGRPFGDDRWQQAMTQTLGLQSSYRSAGRPRHPSE